MEPIHHNIFLLILQALAGGSLGLISAGLAGRFGWRAADRLPGEPYAPQCPFCLCPTKWREALPLLGWVLRKEAQTFPCPCGARRGLWAQPAAEMCGFALGIAAILIGGWGWAALPLILGLGLLPALAMVDLQLGIIPDEMNALLALFGFLWMWWGPGDLSLGLISAAALLALGLFFALVYSRWRGREMLGLGDVKFLAAAGLWLHPESAAWFLALAGIIGAAGGVLWQRMGGGKESPFGPALCFALAACVLTQLSRIG